MCAKCWLLLFGLLAERLFRQIHLNFKSLTDGAFEFFFVLFFFFRECCFANSNWQELYFREETEREKLAASWSPQTSNRTLTLESSSCIILVPAAFSFINGQFLVLTIYKEFAKHHRLGALNVSTAAAKNCPSNFFLFSPRKNCSRTESLVPWTVYFRSHVSPTSADHRAKKLNWWSLFAIRVLE